MNAIGKYKLLDQMGVSAVGTTYRASDTFRNRELVVKVLDPAITGSEQLREQVCRDLAAAADLRHPHIATVRDLGEVDGAIYVATELLNGSDLQHLERRAYTLADKLELMVQVCGGLSYAHSKGMPHGNIKPGNIFVTGKEATILDFGIGKCLSSIVEAGGRPAALVPDYFAPEQILGKPLKARSDIFSVAVVLYELLVNKHPFPGGAGLIPREIVHTPHEPMRNLDPQIPVELEQLMARALEKDPEQRLERADEFAAGLYLIAQKLRGAVAPAVEAAPPAPAPVVVASTPAPAPPVPVVTPAPPTAPNASEVTLAAPPAVVPAAQPTPKVISAPPQRLKRASPPAKRSRLRIWLPYAAAGVLAFGLTLTFLSRQSMRASQPKNPPPVAVQPHSPAQAEKLVETPAAPVSAPATSVVAAPTEPAKPQLSEEQVQMNEVKSLWASGKYAQALEKVNDILAAHPDNMEGRVWKKKIRAAQDAEAAMK